MAELRILPPAARFLKKIRNKRLKAHYQKAIDAIWANPSLGKEKSGDLNGIRCYYIYYSRINYELAYNVEQGLREDTAEHEIIVVIMAGTRENFYDAFKRYWQ